MKKRELSFTGVIIIISFLVILVIAGFFFAQMINVQLDDESTPSNLINNYSVQEAEEAVPGGDGEESANEEGTPAQEESNKEAEELNESCESVIERVAVKVAFIGDQGITTNAKAVLNMIKHEGAQMVLHQGDFDYQQNPSLWDQQITDILGDDYPYFATPGNHDKEDGQWTAVEGYKQKLEERLAKIPGAVCTGEYGEKAICEYLGIKFILSGIGTVGPGRTESAEFITQEFGTSDSIWELCTWHKNQNIKSNFY